MYESPIEMIIRDREIEIEGAIVKAVWEQDIHVDKEELEKALLYDRKQYVKGYEDGVKGLEEVFSEIKKEFIKQDQENRGIAKGLYIAMEIMRRTCSNLSLDFEGE